MRVTYNEETHAEDDGQDHLLLKWQTERENDWDGDEQHTDVAAQIEYGLDHGVVFQGRALRVRWWHAPVALEWDTEGEKSNLHSYPANANIYCEPSYVFEVICCNCHARVHDEHACF